MAQILLVEDDSDIALMVQKTLEPEHTVITCSTLSQARELISKNIHNLILLDGSLPDGDGFEFLASIKSLLSQRKTPVLFLTGKVGIADQVLGFSLGAEDYLTKPFHPILLQTRVNAKLKRYSEMTESDQFSVEDLRFDISKQRVLMRTHSGEQEITLTPIEFKLLLYFARHVDHVFSRDQLMSNVWGDHVHVFERTVDTHVSHLRSKLKGCAVSIESVQGVGYRLALVAKDKAAG